MRNYERNVDGKLSEKDIDEIVAATVADSRMEGLETPDDEIGKLKELMRGDISEAEYKAWVLEKAGVRA